MTDKEKFELQNKIYEDGKDNLIFNQWKRYN